MSLFDFSDPEIFFSNLLFWATIFFLLYLWYKGVIFKGFIFNKVKLNEEPTTPQVLKSSIRDWNDLPVAFVATMDGGEVAAFWDNEESLWISAPDMSGKALSSPSMDTETSERIKRSMNLGYGDGK